MNKKVLVYDIEILNAIPNRDGYREPGINYCKGWEDHAGMGIAVIGVWDYVTAMPIVICKDNLGVFRQMATEYDLIVGFNHVRFDNEILAANGITFKEDAVQYDILRELWIADGLDPHIFDPRTHGGYTLDACALANFNVGKSGNGALAPIDWQKGRVGNVISYCLRDVALTKALWERILAMNTLVHPKTRAGVRITPPFTSSGQLLDDDIPW